MSQSSLCRFAIASRTPASKHVVASASNHYSSLCLDVQRRCPALTVKVAADFCSSAPALCIAQGFCKAHAEIAIRSKVRNFSTDLDDRGYPRDPVDPRRRLSPAAARNKEPILKVISEYLERPSNLEQIRVLEIASGTGEHVAHFASALPHTSWQPSEWMGHPSLDHKAQDIHDICASISAWSEGLANVLPPIALNAADFRWPGVVESEGIKFEAVLAVNLVHIAPLDVLQGLLAGSARVLRPGGYLFLYGPFAVAGEDLLEGNAAFDCKLKAVNEHWGLREVNTIETAADLVGLNLVDVEEMPANNKILTFTRLWTAPTSKPSVVPH